MILDQNEGTRRSISISSWLYVFGFGLLFLWGLWWLGSIYQNRLLFAKYTWTPAYHFLGVDFLHNYNVARLWLEGGNPYQELSGAPLEIRYPYPPLVIRLFAWCGLFPPLISYDLWVIALALMAGLGIWWAWRCRHQLGLYDLPLPFLLAVVILSTPVFYAMERGNHDLLVVLFIGISAWALKNKTIYHDIFAGILLGVAAWAKIYPGFLLIGLLALRRWWAVVGYFLSSGMIVGLDIDGTRQFVDNLKTLVAQTGQAVGEPVSTMRHTLSGSWQAFWEDTPLRILTKIPGILGTAYLLFPPVLLVSYQIYKSPHKLKLVYPYFLWLAAVATFFPSISNDYNLVFLPLAAVAVWDPKDSFLNHLMMFFLLLWWQPFRIPLGGKFLLVCKLLGITAVGFCIIHRSQEEIAEKVKGVLESDAWRRIKEKWRGFQIARSLLYLSLGMAFLFTATAFGAIFPTFSLSENKKIAYARTLEAILPERALILQLPFASSPSGHPDVDSYFWGHLYSENLRWSYAVKGREGYTWQNQIIKPFKVFIETLVYAGVDGISLDRHGYADSGAEIEKKLSQILDVKPVESMDQRFAFYGLQKFRDKLREGLPEGEWEKNQASALRPLFIDWQGGFSGLEGIPEGDNWRWSASDGDLYILNPSQDSKNINLKMILASAYPEISDLKITSPWFAESLKINSTGTSFSKTLEVPPGRHRVRFSSTGKRFYAPYDDRVLVFKVINFRLSEVD